MNRDDWYLLRTKPRQEQIALDNLQRQKFHCFAPQAFNPSRKLPSQRPRVEFMFPGYVFLRRQEGSADLSAASYTRGVTTMVRFGHELARIPHQLIQRMKSMCCPETGLLQLDHPDISPEMASGQGVRLFDGPFAGLEGVFEMPDGQQRAWILVEILGRSNRIKVEQRHLQSI